MLNDNIKVYIKSLCQTRVHYIWIHKCRVVEEKGIDKDETLWIQGFEKKCVKEGGGKRGERKICGK